MNEELLREEDKASYQLPLQCNEVGKKFDCKSLEFIPLWFIFWRGKEAENKASRLWRAWFVPVTGLEETHEAESEEILVRYRKKAFHQKMVEHWNRLPREVTALAWQSWRHVWAILSGICVLRCPCRARTWTQWSWCVRASSAYSSTVILWLTTESLIIILLAPYSAYWYFLKLSVFSSTFHLFPLYCCHQNLKICIVEKL